MTGRRVLESHWIGKDPFLSIKVGNKEVHKTETITDDLNPVWSSFQLDVATCGGLDTELCFEVYDFDRLGK